MSKRVPILLILAAAGVVATPAAGTQMGFADYPVAPEYRPATALDPMAVARTVETAAGRRIAVRNGDQPPVLIGPGTRGDDGAPAMARTENRDLILLAARHRGTRAELWLQRQRSGVWETPRRLRMPGSNHHPAIATDNGSTWAVWLRGEGTDRSVMAATVDGTRMGSDEILPRVGTEAGVPAIGFDSRGRAVAVWSAFDGTDTEIWLSRREASGWSDPLPLSNNDVPDEFPSVGRGADGTLTVSWSSFTPDGYLPTAVFENRSESFGPPTALDVRPAGLTQVLGDASGIVTWVGVRATTHELMSTTRTRTGWSPARSAGVVASPRVHASTQGRRLLVAAGEQEHTGLVSRDPRESGVKLELDLPAPLPEARAADPLPVSGTYRGFGDSITEGVIRFDDVVVTPGYPGPLAEYLGAYLGRPKLTVENAGLGGEITAEGLGRLAQLNAGTPRQVTLIMEGINDATQSVAAATVTANLRAMIRGSQGADRLAVISTITPRTSNNFAGGSNPTIKLYNEMLVPMARSEGAFLVDQYAAFFKKAHLYSDLLHPNEQGYTHMAVTWFRALQPLLNDLLYQQDTTTAQPRKDTHSPNRSGRPIQ